MGAAASERTTTTEHAAARWTACATSYWGAGTKSRPRPNFLPPPCSCRHRSSARAAAGRQ
eukprot:2197191-Rhodomonas_salina.1